MSKFQDAIEEVLKIASRENIEERTIYASTEDFKQGYKKGADIAVRLMMEEMERYCLEPFAKGTPSEAGPRGLEVDADSLRGHIKSYTQMEDKEKKDG